MIALIFSALLPIALVIALGYGFKRIGFPGADFWPGAERLAYFVLLPVLFAHSLATAEIDGLTVAPMAIALVGTAVVITILLMAAKPLLRIDGPAFTSVVQGGIRFNNYVAVTAAVGLLGVDGAALAAVANAALVPTVNVLCALVFAVHGTQQPTVRGVVRSIALNPLILGCVAGLALRFSGIGLPPGIGSFMGVVGQAALPIGLLCVGAALDWSALGRGLRPSLIATVIKFVVTPLFTVAACLMLGLSGPAALIVLLVQAMPTASSSYMMARQLGGDAPLMAGIIALQTTLAVITLPLTLLVLGPLIGGGG